MDFGRAFNYPRNDPGWITKILILGVLGIIPIVNLVAGGYVIEAIRRVASGEEATLPEWDNFGAYFMDGLRIFVTMLVFAIPVIVVFIVTFGATFAMGMGHHEGGAGAGILMLLASAFQFLWEFLVAVVIPAILVQLALSSGFGAGFQFGRVFGIITRNVGTYLMVLLGMIGFGILGGLGMIACGIGVIFTMPWAQLATAHLMGQMARQNVDPGMIA